MLEIYLIVIGILIPLGVAKKGNFRRKRFRRYIRGNIDESLGFSGLAANTMVDEDLADVVTETTYVSSVVCSYNLIKWTPEAAAGPLLFGWAHSDYNAAEVEAYLEQSTNWSQADLVAQEIARRKIKIVGTIVPAELATQSASFMGGKMITTKLGWTLQTSQTLSFWVYNTGIAAQVTTTAEMQAHGHANLWPR